jgi:hypothetical protein
MEFPEDLWIPLIEYYEKESEETLMKVADKIITLSPLTNVSLNKENIRREIYSHLEDFFFANECWYENTITPNFEEDLYDESFYEFAKQIYFDILLNKYYNEYIDKERVLEIKELLRVTYIKMVYEFKGIILDKTKTRL